MEGNSGIFEEQTQDIQADEFSDTMEIHRSDVYIVSRRRAAGRFVAVKTLSPERVADINARQRLRKEYDIMVSLDHPGIVRALSFEESAEDGPRLVMDFIDGETLDRYLARGVSRAERLRLLREVAVALSYLHSKGIVHRDIKPQNIMVSRLGNFVRIIDFGLADSDSHFTAKQPAGTKGFVSPEQKESRVPDLRNDVYSFGCLMETLSPGIPYKWMVRKCKGAVERRFRSAEELIPALDRSRTFARLGWMFFAVLVVASICFVAFLKPKTRPSVEQALPVAAESAVVSPDGNVDSVAAPAVNPRDNDIASVEGVADAAAEPGKAGKETRTNSRRDEVSTPHSDTYIPPGPNEKGVTEAEWNELVEKGYAETEFLWVGHMEKLRKSDEPEKFYSEYNEISLVFPAREFMSRHKNRLSDRQRKQLGRLLSERIKIDKQKWHQLREQKLRELNPTE